MLVAVVNALLMSVAWSGVVGKESRAVPEAGPAAPAPSVFALVFAMCGLSAASFIVCAMAELSVGSSARPYWILLSKHRAKQAEHEPRALMAPELRSAAYGTPL